MTVATLALPKPTSLTLLRRLTLGAARSDVVFNLLEQNYRHLMLDVTGASTTGTAAAGHAFVQFNGDTNTASYTWMELRGHNVGPAADAIERLAGVDAGCIIGFTGTGANANTQDMARAMVYDYAGSTFHKSLLADESALVPSTGFDAVVTFSGWWLNKAPIHTVRFLPEAGNWAANTTFSIWGVS